ncbi:hypothetical protein RIF29_38391 [Crotalaria pallida]|uniref:H(+)-exporting diphosphatase n=1 Tax=Crotalaria pallida TaxID=3830 RepID=A0AAN9HNW5_CROPI
MRLPLFMYLVVAFRRRCLERNISEDDPRKQAVIADNVGDNVGVISGNGSDFFGSYAESSHAALLATSISSFGVNHEYAAMLYPLTISSVGILVCLLTPLLAIDFFEFKAVKEIEPTLKRQLVISPIFMTEGIALVSWLALLSSVTIFNFGVQKVVKNRQLFLCVAVGLWARIILGFVTEHYTSNVCNPAKFLYMSAIVFYVIFFTPNSALGYLVVVAWNLLVDFTQICSTGHIGLRYAILGLVPTCKVLEDQFCNINSSCSGICCNMFYIGNCCSCARKYTSPKLVLETNNRPNNLLEGGE